MDELQEAQQGGLEETFASSGADFRCNSPAGIKVVSRDIWNHHTLHGFQLETLTHSRPTAGQAHSSIHASKRTKICWEVRGTLRNLTWIHVCKRGFPCWNAPKISLLTSEMRDECLLISWPSRFFFSYSCLILDWEALFVQRKHLSSRSKSRLHLSPTKCQNKVQGSRCSYCSKSTFFSLISQTLSNKLV